MAEPWRPLLQGEAARRAHAAIHAIAAAPRASPVPSFQLAALRAQAAREGDDALPDDVLSARQASLARGAAGAAIFHAELARITGDDADREHAAALRDLAIDAPQSGPPSVALYGGFPGIALAADHVNALLFGSDDEDDVDDGLEEALLAALGERPWRGPWDLVSGLVGLGVCALGRPPSDRAIACIRAVVAHLDALALPSSGGRTWFRSPSLLMPWQLDDTPDGFADLGVAHGVAGVIALLGEIMAAAPSPQAAALLDDAVTWLLAQRLAPSSESAFPARIVPGRAPLPCRSAWCYGDPGVAVALLIAARGAGRPDWERVAIDVGLHAARRPPADAGVIDAGLCHGAAGLGHIFHRLHQASGDAELGAAASFWLHRAIDLCERIEPDADASLLNGTSGVGLALLAAVSPHPPTWDRALLLCVPDRAQG